jgi:UDP-N-acetylmuramoylalanine--D-glutamate ligase
MEQQQRMGKTLIVGLGKTGLSCARYLAARGIPAAVIDSREQPPGLAALREELPDTALFLGGFEPAVFQEAELLVVSPGISLREPVILEALARGVEVVGDVELFARDAAAPVVAITGSNGKSTVTTLVGEMAREAGLLVKVGGNLGEPALDLLDPATELYVLELSSFQLETTRSLRPIAATVLNVSPDHMDRYQDVGEYAAAKERVYRNAIHRIFNRDDSMVMKMSDGEEGDLYFTLGKPVAGGFGLRMVAGHEWLCHGEQKLLPAAELLIPGRHNLANALAALALGTALNLPENAMLTALRRFHGLPHRTQFVAEQEGVRWYNDSKGTNVGACIAALEGLAEGEGRTVLIAGGDCKGADFSLLAPVVTRTARAVILIGRDAPELEQALAGTVPLLRAEDLTEAVALAAEQAQAGDRVLLSPACASFDMFRNFEERGERFMAAVRRQIG